MNLLIVGGAGYIGSMMSHYFLKKGYKVKIFDKLYFGIDPIKDIIEDDNCELIEGDIVNINTYKGIFNNIDAVIHLAGLSNNPSCDLNPDWSVEVNQKATHKLACLAKDNGVQRFLFASSCSVYGKAKSISLNENSRTNPVTVYAQTKFHSEEILRSLQNENFHPTILRMATVFGWSYRMRFDLAINMMTLYAYNKGRIFVTGGGEQWRPFVHVMDVVKAYEIVFNAPLSKISNQIFNLGSNDNNIQIKNLAYMVQEKLPSIQVDLVPEDSDQRTYHVSFDKIASELSYKTQYSIQAGIKDVLTSLKAGKVKNPDDIKYFNIKILLSKINRPVIDGGLPIRINFLPLAIPSLGEEEREEVWDSMKSGWLTGGPKTMQFEAQFVKFTKANYAIAVNSCTAALHLALVYYNIGIGDEVITTPITFASTANVITHVNATPVFVDVDPLTLNIDVDRIEEKITSKTKAIIVVHMAGRPCDMRRVKEIADKHNIPVIEDAAHAVGSSYDNKPIGSISDITCFSFYPTKNITAAEGGMITTNSEESAEKFKILRLHGMSKDAWARYTPEGKLHWQLLLPGYKYNMTDIQAAIGIHQLKKLPGFKQRREELVRMYNETLSGIPEIILPPLEKNINDVCWHLYIIQLNTDMLKVSRDEFALALKKENIGFGFHFISLHLQPFYKNTYNLKPEDLPNASLISNRILSLPLYPKMTKKDLEDVVFSIKKLIKYFKK